MIQRLLALLLVAGVPLLYSSSTLDPNVLPRLTFAWALVCLFGIVLFTKSPGPKSRFELPTSIFWIIAGLGLYSLAASVSIFYAINTAEAIYETARSLLALSILVMLIIALTHDEKLIILLSRAIALVMILDTIIGACQSFGLGFDFIPGGINPRGLNAQQNQFASYLLLGTPFLGLLILKDIFFWRLTAIMALLLSVFAFVLSHSFGVWAVSAIVLIISLVIIIFRRKSLIILFATALVLITGVLLYYFYYTAWFFHYVRAGHDMYRYNLWAKSIQMISDHFFTGVGAGNWKIALPEYGLEKFGGLFADGWMTWVWPHEEWLAVMSETGLVGLTGMLIFFGGILILLWKRLYIAPHAPLNKPILLLMAGILIYLGYTLFSFERERIEHLTLLILLVTAGLYYGNKTPVSGKPTLRISLKFVSIGLIIIGLSGAVLGVVRWKSEIHTRRAAIARLEQDWKTVVEESSLAQSFFYTVDPTAVPVAWYAGVGYWNLNDIPAAEQAFRQALTCHPNHLHTLINLAACCASKGLNDEAKRHYEKALSISPQYIEARLNYAAFLANTGDRDRAIETLNGYKDTNDPQIRLYLDQINSMKEQLK